MKREKQTSAASVSPSSFAVRWLRRTPFRPIHIGHHIRTLYFRKYLAQLPLTEFHSVLDAGCGNGTYAIPLAAGHPWLTVLGIDLHGPEFPQPLPANFSFRQMDLRFLSDQETFDFIYCIDVLEHIPGNSVVIGNFVRALKKGGFLFLHVPYDQGEKRVLPKRFFRAFDNWAKKEHRGEQYSLAELQARLEANGLHICAAAHTFGFPGKLAWELDRLTDNRRVAKIALMPLLKLLAQVAVRRSHRHGSCLVLSCKPGPGTQNPGNDKER